MAAAGGGQVVARASPGPAASPQRVATTVSTVVTTVTQATTTVATKSE